MDVAQHFSSDGQCKYCSVKLPECSDSMFIQHLSIHCPNVPKHCKQHMLPLELSPKTFDINLECGSPKSEGKRVNCMRMSSLEIQPATTGVYYHDYLQLDKILNAQEMESGNYGDAPAHDEHLFIVIHQTYELWFKQILFEVDAARKIFEPEFIGHRALSKAVSGFNRVSEIFRVINQQLTILETMTPLGFLDFRDYLFPASGFQSVQFRKLEVKLGLTAEQRVSYGKRSYCSYLSNKHGDECQLAENEKSIYTLVEAWLERTPFLEFGSFSFWKHYKDATSRMEEADVEFIKASDTIPEDEKPGMYEELRQKYKHHAMIYDESEYDALKAKGSVRLSLKAMQAALLIMLYQDEPLFQLPHRLLMQLFDVDQHLTQWRYRHTSMVNRMIGSKMGTGGSSGYNYLRATASQHRIFKDLFQLPSFLIPRKDLPELPQDIMKHISFRSES